MGAETDTDTDPSLLAHALGVAAKARGMLEVSRDTGVDRAGLYRSFVKGGDPRIGTFDKVAQSMGYHLTLAPFFHELSCRSLTHPRYPALP
jgi:probable addiction module antidote protein